MDRVTRRRRYMAARHGDTGRIVDRYDARCIAPAERMSLAVQRDGLHVMDPKTGGAEKGRQVGAEQIGATLRDVAASRDRCRLGGRRQSQRSP